jgi:uncharacterized protein GlcG (DUF336 family)
MKLTRFLTFSIVAAATAHGAFGQALPARKVLTIDVAQAIAQEALVKCRADGFKVTVTVVDSTNIVKVLLSDDGAARATVEIGRLKNNSVMAFGRASGPPANLPPGAPVPAPLLSDTINAMGGVPINVDGQLIGSVSVSGAPGGDKDAACAKAGLAKVADKLK